jgi:hypothetical protein
MPFVLRFEREREVGELIIVHRFGKRWDTSSKDNKGGLCLIHRSTENLNLAPLVYQKGR